jgi:cytochrome c biogenesis protein CcmG, thiol:disulfide interchange protein DsbE
MGARDDKRRRMIAIGLALAALAVCVAAVITALGEEGSGEPGPGNPESAVSLAEATAPLRDAPAELAALRKRANAVVAGPDAFDALLEDLKGYPVVVNAWASWCGPCRFEFPFFQSQAVAHEEKVAFVGIDVADDADSARTFLEELPLPYPSYSDPDYELMRAFDLGQYLPSTVFIDERGEVVHTKLGPYTDEADLAADINRYAG